MAFEVPLTYTDEELLGYLQPRMATRDSAPAA